MPLCTGSMTLVKVYTDTARLVLYTGFAGLAGRIGHQAPQFAVQNILPTTPATMGLTITLFAQSSGPAICVVVAQTIFTSCLSINSGLGVTSLGSMGLSDLRNSLVKDDVENEALGVDMSISQTCYLAVALACLIVTGSLGINGDR